METVTPMDAEAKATHGFMAFGGTAAAPVLTASLGSVMIGVVTTPAMLRNAQAEDDDVAAVTTPGSETDEMMGADGMWEEVRSLSDIIAPKATLLANPVTVSGDLSFASKVAWLPGSCSGLAGVTGTLMATDANDFASAMHLCLMVDGETAITKGDYSVTTEYAPKSSSHAFAAQGDTHALGSITRDGSSFSVPFLVVQDRFNQRINMVNRGSRDVQYTLGELKAPLHTGGTARAKAMATGNLPANSNIVIRVSDMVEFTGATRGAGVLSMPADSSNIDVSIDMVNPETGTIDTTIVQSN